MIHLAAFTPKSAATRDSAQEIIAANIIGLQTLLTSFLSPPGDSSSAARSTSIHARRSNTRWTSAAR